MQSGAGNAGREPLSGELEILHDRCLDLSFQVVSLSRQLEVAKTQLQVFQNFSLLSTHETNLDDLLNRILTLILDVLGAEAGGVFLVVNRDRGEYRIAAAQGSGAERLRQMSFVDWEGVPGWVMKSGKPYLSVDPHHDPRTIREIGEIIPFPIRNILCVPLTVNSKAMGAIGVLNKKQQEPFHKEDLSLLSGLARQMAVVLENMGLLTASHQQLRQVSLLTKVSALLNSSLNQESVRRQAMEAAVELMECEAGSLLLLDEETGELFFEVALGEKGDQIKEVRLRKGEGIAGWVAEHREPLLVPDVSKDPRHSGLADQKSKFITRNVLCVPVTIKDRIIGVLQAINRLHGENFKEEDIGLFQSLAHQVAIAIENARLYQETQQAFKSAVAALSEAIEKRDPYTGGHTRRVVTYSLAIADELDLSREEKGLLEMSAYLHDIGKIGVEDQVLRKPGRLTEEEMEQMKAHPKMGSDIMEHIRQLHAVLPGMRHHHERYDGKGYPDGLKGEEIPLQAMIISVADTLDAMTSDRPYRKALSFETAYEEICRNAGTQLSERVVEAFKEAFRKGKIVPLQKVLSTAC